MKRKLIFIISLFTIFIITGCSTKINIAKSKNNDVLVNKRVLSAYHLFPSNKVYPTKIRFSPDGRYLFSTGFKGQWRSDNVEIWDVKKEKKVHTFNREENGISRNSDFAFSPDGKYFLSSVDEFWQRRGRDGKLNAPPHLYNSFGFFNKNGKVVSKCYYDRKTSKVVTRKKIINPLDNVPSIKIFDANTFKYIKSIRSNYTSSDFFRFSPDGKYLISDAYARSGNYAVLDGKKYNFIKDIDDKATKKSKRAIIKSIIFSDDGKYIADLYYTITPYKNYKEYCKEPQNHRYCEIAPLRLLKRTIFTKDSYNIRVWNTETLELVQEIKDVGRGEIISFTNDSKSIIKSASKILHFPKGYSKKEEELVRQHYPLKIFDIKSGKKIYELSNNKDAESSFVASILGDKYLIIPAYNITTKFESIQVIDFKTQEVIQTIKIDLPVATRAFMDISKNQKTLAIGTKDEIWLYDIRNPKNKE